MNKDISLCLRGAGSLLVSQRLPVISNFNGIAAGVKRVHGGNLRMALGAIGVSAGSFG